MTFNNEDEAWDYWQENVWYLQGEGYVGLGRCFDDQVDIFKEWLDENAIGWPDEPNRNLQD